MGLGVGPVAVQGGLVLEHGIPQDLQLLVACLLPTATRHEGLPHQGQRWKRPVTHGCRPWSVQSLCVEADGVDWVSSFSYRLGMPGGGTGINLDGPLLFRLMQRSLSNEFLIWAGYSSLMPSRRPQQQVALGTAFQPSQTQQWWI